MAIRNPPQASPAVPLVAIRGRGGIGRHARFRFLCSGVKVRVLSSAPYGQAVKPDYFFVDERTLTYGSHILWKTR